MFGFGLLLASNCAYYNTFYNAEKYYKEGVSRYQTNPNLAKSSFAKAIEKSALVISNYPKSKYIADALFIIGMSHFYTGEYTKAVSKFENLLLVFPNYRRTSEANLYWAASLIENQEYNAAIERLQILNRQAVSSEIQELAMFKTAELYFFRKDYSEALSVLRNYLSKYPKSKEYNQALLMLGDAERMVKNFNSASTTYEVCLKKIRQQTGDAGVDTSQLYKRVNLHLAECFIESGRQDEGFVIIDEIVSADTLRGNKSKLSGKVFLDLGNLFLRRNEPVRARFYLRKVTSMPEQIEAYYRLANSYESEAKFDTAKAYYDSVVRRRATGELSTLAKSRLELLKLVVSEIPLIPVKSAPKDTIKTEPKEIKPLVGETFTDTLALYKLNPPDTMPLDTQPLFQDPFETSVETETTASIKTDTTPQIDSAAVQFHLAEIYNLNLNQYERAVAEYGKVYQKYPKSSYAPKAMFAQIWLYKNMMNAVADTSRHYLTYKQALETIIATYPRTEYAAQARKMLAELPDKQ